MKKFNLEENKNVFIEAYTMGTIKDVQEKFGISAKTVNKYAKELGILKGNARPTKRKLVFDDLTNQDKE